ncbi:Flagellar basal-body rod protein FlgG [Thermogutta terrifontis]|uniref:Flagellar basal-body rod protein FlgG n=1 Tax=Thermogutta terrifontis TaxID=1331910 RepID=A0A286RLV9_9BACT|nr:flagellar basal-body rod protein FlgG [Thermogutta terrifontis]ASV76956.1 Flagellar basal-body rod protein FlgG [Thermogutta terrifontis]
MSVQTLYSAATGMLAMEKKLDVIANNLANVETTAFKRDRANFEDLFYRHEVFPGTEDSSGQYTPIGISIGLGSRLSGVQTEFRQGAFQQTSNPLDVAIEGAGFFQVLDPSGQIYYTRAGNFSINANGNLVLGSAHTGRLLEPPIVIPNDATAITITPEGRVFVQQPNNPQLTPVGEIQLVNFINPEGLLKLGENLYAETDASGPPQAGTPGQEGLGILRQNALEASNVEPVRELIDLITTQRAFEMNSQAVQVGDQMMQLVSNLRRY